MATNFRIIRQGNASMLRLSLVGDFDRVSAAELVRTLGENKDADRVVICTSCLEKIKEKGVRDLSRGLAGRRSGDSELFFTGWNAGRVAPPGSTVLHV